jgi:hypothetical protein
MGDLQIKLNVKLEDDEPSNKAAIQTPNHTPLRRQFGLFQQNSTAQSQEQENDKIHSTQPTDA